MNVNTETSTNPIIHVSIVNGHTETKQLNWSISDIQELKYSMLMQSLEELKDNRRSKSMKLEALNWLMIDDQSNNPFSAENCCYSLDMNINTIRSFVQKLLVTGVIKL